MGALATPAPLPSLKVALSRRAALFGTVASTGALAGATVLADDRLTHLADAITDATKAGVRSEAFEPRNYFNDPAWQRAVDEFFSAAAEMRDTPATSAGGIAAKARAMQQPWVTGYNEVMVDIGASLAADVLRLSGVSA